MNSAADVWTKVLFIMENELGMSSTTISTWFDDAKALSLKNETFILETPAKFKKDIILNHHADKIKEALFKLFSSQITLEVYSEDEIPPESKISEQECPEEDEYTFDSFVIGESNKFAHAAAKAVAHAPAKSYNPLLIYGGSGLGKTHLLYAIAGTINSQLPNSKVTYVKGDDFTNEMIEALEKRTIPNFRDKYRNSDLLLVDDIQFIAGKDRTQEEFFHTFNALYESKKQIVLTSDRLPMEMTTLEERLRTRFEWGLMADIQPPDFETRMAIISVKSSRLGLRLPQHFKEIIANNVTSNVRQLEGTVKKILAYKDLLSNQITQEIVEKAIKDVFLENPGLNPTPDLIISAVSKYFQTDTATLVGKNRSRVYVVPRQIAMYLIREILNMSFPEIAKIFNKDHTTVLYSINRITDQLAEKEDLKNQIRDIRCNILDT